MHKVSVSNLDLYRTWREDEELDLAWLLDRLTRREQTENMIVGEALHKALETAKDGEFMSISANGYTFQFLDDVELYIPQHREISISQQYGDLLVRGRVDCVDGIRVEDHKTTQYFDPDRFLSGYQWRFYLDMMGANLFRWNVFELADTDDESVYVIRNFHRLEQMRYPKLHEDCAKLAAEYLQFAEQHLALDAVDKVGA
jgi:hypothetical protein